MKIKENCPSIKSLFSFPYIGFIVPAVTDAGQSAFDATPAYYV